MPSCAWRCFCKRGFSKRFSLKSIRGGNLPPQVLKSSIFREPSKGVRQMFSQKYVNKTFLWSTFFGISNVRCTFRFIPKCWIWPSLCLTTVEITMFHERNFLKPWFLTDSEDTFEIPKTLIINIILKICLKIRRPANFRPPANFKPCSWPRYKKRFGQTGN